MAVSRERDVVVDPRFAVPEGTVDVRYENKDNGESSYDAATRASNTPTLSDPTSPIPIPPATFTIVEQIVRMGIDGRSVVDVIIDFPDINGIDDIQIRATPV